MGSDEFRGLRTMRHLLTTVTMLVAALAASASASAPATSGNVEFPIETAAIVKATAAFFDRVEASAPAERKLPPVIGLPQLATPASLDLTDAQSQFDGERGPVAHLTGYRINWYPVDRMIGAVDFMGTWNENRDLVCGFLIWDLSDPALPALDSVVVNYVDVGDLSSTDAHGALLDANCAYGEIDQNFTVFAVEN